MKPITQYELINKEEAASSSLYLQNDSMDVFKDMRSIFLVNSSFSLSGNPKAVNFKTLELPYYEVSQIKIKDMYVDSSVLDSEFSEKIIRVIPLPATIDADKVMQSLRLEADVVYVVNATNREITSFLDSIQRRMNSEYKRELYILDKKSFTFNETNVISTIEKFMPFDVVKKEFVNPYMFGRMFLKDIMEKLFLNANGNDGELYFNFINPTSGVSLNPILSTSVDNEYLNKVFFTAAISSKEASGESFYDMIDLRGILFMVVLGILFENSDKQTSKNGRTIPLYKCINCDEDMIEDISYAITDSVSCMTFFSNADNNGEKGVIIDYTRSTNKTYKELEGVVAIETSIALQKLCKRRFTEIAKNLGGASNENLMSFKLAMKTFMEKLKEFKMVKSAENINFEERITSAANELYISNKYVLATETKGLYVTITKEV